MPAQKAGLNPNYTSYDRSGVASSVRDADPRTGSTRPVYDVADVDAAGRGPHPGPTDIHADSGRACLQ